MDTNQILLETKLVSEIKGTFYVPSYQRGYRWGADEVIRLLDDVYQNGRKTYCLQPIVVRKSGDCYELIDGQQRLTTLYLIYKYLNHLNADYYDEPQFSLIYETRSDSEEYLKSMDLSKRDCNIDFWFMANAYETIGTWFRAEKRVRDRAISDCFDLFTKVIWYEVGESEDAISLFTRLNIGKIPLTSAELVKAMFLREYNEEGLKEKIREERALQWDNMEKVLHDNALWYFLTNQTSADYQTRIDLILDLYTEKPSDNRVKYYTFFEIDKKRKKQSEDGKEKPEDGKEKPENEKTLDEIWREIQHTFLILTDWYKNHEFYHKIGYLIASNKKTLQEIYSLSKGKTKQEFRQALDSCICDSIKIKGNYADLSYEKPQHYKRISRLLLLFNVESVRQNGENTQWFPFDKFKFDRKGSVAWSLEHIHAQQSEGMRTQELWKEWLSLHIPSVRSVTADAELIEAMQAAVEKPDLKREEFDVLQQKVTELLSVQGNTEYLHNISNLALLRSDDNAALNNSTFDVKRSQIVEMDKKGKYIPFCTKMVFLKYYTPSDKNQIHFWGQVDRTAYIKTINEVLKPYLSEPIAMMEEA